MTTRTILVFGTGPGVGDHIAKQFASNGFNHVILLARNEARLQKSDAPFVAAAGPNVKIDTLRLDLADLGSIPAVLKEIEKLTEGATVEVVLFNAARISPSTPLETPLEEIEEDFKTTNLALYLIAQWAIPRLIALGKSNPSSKPTLLVTNSSLPWDPIPPLLSLSLVKAAQRNMVQSFDRAFSHEGLHTGLISCEGQVAPENKYLNPANIAEQAWKFFESGTGLEVNIKEL